MRLYLDQCLRSELTPLLRDHGHDALRTSETGQARADAALVLNRSITDKRTLVTSDGHFGDWVVLPLSKHFGVIRIETHPPTVDRVAALLLPLMAHHSAKEFLNRLVIVSPARVRWIQTSED